MSLFCLRRRKWRRTIHCIVSHAPFQLMLPARSACIVLHIYQRCQKCLHLTFFFLNIANIFEHAPRNCKDKIFQNYRCSACVITVPVPQLMPSLNKQRGQKLRPRFHSLSLRPMKKAPPFKVIRIQSQIGTNSTVMKNISKTAKKKNHTCTLHASILVCMKL